MKLILLMIPIIMVSCMTKNKPETIGVYEREGCEYFIERVGESKVDVHKGNCRNKIHYQVIHDTVYINNVNYLKPTNY